MGIIPMLKNFWWPVEFSHNVTNKPLEMQALGQRFVLWRDSKGKVACLSDLCVHRGGAAVGRLAQERRRSCVRTTAGSSTARATA